jgi:hypothetical protein
MVSAATDSLQDQSEERKKCRSHYDSEFAHSRVPCFWSVSACRILLHGPQDDRSTHVLHWWQQRATPETGISVAKLYYMVDSRTEVETLLPIIGDITFVVDGVQRGIVA